MILFILLLIFVINVYPLKYFKAKFFTKTSLNSINSDFFQWSQRKEINIHNKGLILKENDLNNYRGLFTTSNIHENEILLKIPMNIVFSKLHSCCPTTTTTMHSAKNRNNGNNMILMI